jgi:hypothetical protein
MQENTTAYIANYPISNGSTVDSLQTVAYIWKFESVRYLFVEGTEKQSLHEQPTFLARTERH